MKAKVYFIGDFVLRGFFLIANQTKRERETEDHQ